MHGDVSLPCLVLILGLGMRIEEWPQEAVADLARDFRVICIDNRDSGRSGRCGPNVDSAAVRTLESGAPYGEEPLPYTLFDMRDDVLRVLNELQIGRFAVAGFSMGGMIAQLVAAQASSRVTGMVQICSSAGEVAAPVPEVTWQRFLKNARPFESRDALIRWLAEDLTWCSAPSPLADAVDAAEAMVDGGYTPGGYARQLLALSQSGDRSAYLTQITCPALVIGAAQDRCIEPDSSRLAQRLIPDAELVICGNTGHALEPQVMAHLSSWLRKTLIQRH
ncbi:alpha/beta fold hydrolase [Leisingera sp. ANG-Vp]|uniref:alpha/beta fold hydrolase n=1 Tax=Leisingera sp. ANG-Vp TaxID=1577896 RepID=UPI00058060B2|nr:alpha/beta hydrolase [Leisingera sp. ANG-Vp]KIC20117.1 hypothetical protein RA20_10400 [Leisingera sp. ANG-Vp]